MSRGESAGGGQSSLGYLFGSEEKPAGNTKSTPPTPVVYAPPYGIDTNEDNPLKNLLQPDIGSKAQGLNSGKNITDRPSTKVKSAPGGNSSLGYLFGYKSN